MSEVTSTHYGSTAHRVDDIPALPAPPKKRERIGEQLLPFGDYTGIAPYQQLCEDVELVQQLEQKNKHFYESDNWWWDHQRIRFLKNKLGISSLLLLIPYLWAVSLLGLLIYLTTKVAYLLLPGYPVLGVISVGAMAVLGVVAVIVVSTYTSQWLINSIVRLFSWLLTPFHKLLVNHADRYMKNRCSEFNRHTGMASFAQGKKKPPLVAPFLEFDGYVERVVQRGGIFYRLMFVHRYTGKQFNQTSLSTIVDHKHEVHALWDMLQRYMDVSQPMPDVPRLEPFRHLDPTTAAHDQKTGRNPRYWRDLDLEAWKKGDGAAHLKAQIEYPWSRQRCQLTPQLGKVEMAAYREQQQAPMA